MPVLLVLLALALGLLALTFADRWLWAHLKVADVTALERKDWYQFLRTLGSLYIWLAAGAMLILAAPGSMARGQAATLAIVRGGLLILSAALGGGAAELLKLLTHRLRPGDTGEYLFRHFIDGLTGPGAEQLRKVGFGLASSHTGVAFGAAFMLARLFPKTAPLALALAAGCALTRLLSGAHFATDVYVAVVMSYAIAAALWRIASRTHLLESPHVTA
jgi:membrane-associated phospholipid phosphatase